MDTTIAQNILKAAQAYENTVGEQYSAALKKVTVAAENHRLAEKRLHVIGAEYQIADELRKSAERMWKHHVDQAGPA